MAGVAQRLAALGSAAVLPDDGAMDRPRSQISVVSRWLVMPMAAMAEAVMPALAMAARQVASTLDQISSGSCSTWPGRGKYCGNSSWATATGRNFSSKTMARDDVVPWSMASIWEERMAGHTQRKTATA